MDWQHLVLIDKPGSVTLPAYLAHPKRTIVMCGTAHGWYGNLCRRMAYPHITGDVVLYLDDDDLHVNDTMKTLVGSIGDAPWGVFPALRMGERFFNPQPGKCATMNCQIFHRKVIRGVRIVYPHAGFGCADGDLIELLHLFGPPLMVGGPELASVVTQSSGARPDKENPYDFA